MKRITSVVTTLTLMLSAAAWSATGRAVIKGTTEGSKVSGIVTMEETADGLKIVVQLENAPQGEHGFHIHEFGDCGDMGKNAGSHFNPQGNPHGQIMKDGMAKAHPGDLGNVTIKEDGTGRLEAVVPKLSLSSGEYNVAGHAVVLHEKIDDFSQPVGNAGGRIGCGPILITKQ